MRALLICPVERPAVQSLAESHPLVNFSALGKPFIICWIEHLVTLGAREIRVLAADRPEQIRAVVGDGSRWGVQVEVSPELRELTASEARAKYRRGDREGWLAEPADVTVVDHFPGLPQATVFNSYIDWFSALRAWMLQTASANTQGAREVKPGVWVGLRARVSPTAELLAPCWIGANTIVGEHSIIGPMAILEDRVMVESSVEISTSLVASETFVGELTELKDSYANGSSLINWRTGSGTTVPDAFLMCSLNARRQRRKAGTWLGRLIAFFVMSMTLPIALIPLLKAKARNQPSLSSRVAVRPQLANAPGNSQTMVYYELADCQGWLRLWPQLWNIVRGDFAWVGNRPLSPAEVAELSNDFERLWLAAPIGLVSLAHAEGAPENFSDETRACASFYAVQANWRLDMSIMARTFLASTKKALPSIF